MATSSSMTSWDKFVKYMEIPCTLNMICMSVVTGMCSFARAAMLSQQRIADPLFRLLDSLGGALTSLLAFYLSASGKLQDVLKGRPVTAISFASPQVGDGGYNEAFQVLESKKDLLHVRISNQGDVIPVSPSFFGYTQTGVNLHLHSDKDMEIGYRNLKDITSQLSLHPSKNHSLKTYCTRLQRRNNRGILDNMKTFHGLYDEYAGDLTH